MEAAHQRRTDDEVGDLLTLHEVAELLRVPEATLRYWRYCRSGPVGFKIGRHVRYERREVQAWLHQQGVNDHAGSSW
jgi:excisionase family DNA binding protein